jgi:hypothetical protein
MVEVTSAIGKRIRRDINDAHYEHAVQRKLAARNRPCGLLFDCCLAVKHQGIVETQLKKAGSSGLFENFVD